LFFLFLFKNSKNQKFVAASLLFLSYFLHPYYFLILSISLISSIFIDVVIERKIATEKFLALLLGIILLTPIINWYVKYFPKREEKPISGTLSINLSSLTVNHFSILSLVPIFNREDRNVNTLLQPLTIVFFLPILFCYLLCLRPKSIRNKNVYTFLLLILVSTLLVFMKWENIEVKVGSFSFMTTSPSFFELSIST
jgi:ABC-type Na+ efflux pump permease subunit